MLNGFVVGAIVTISGSGYGSNVAVSFVGGRGSNATAVATVSNGVVVEVTITDAGIGYTSTPIIIIAPPPANALWPTVSLALALSLSSLSPLRQLSSGVYSSHGRGAWSNSGMPFTPTSTMSTQYVNEIDDVGYFRVKNVP